MDGGHEARAGGVVIECVVQESAGFGVEGRVGIWVDEEAGRLGASVVGLSRLGRREAHHLTTSRMWLIPNSGFQSFLRVLTQI